MEANYPWNDLGMKITGDITEASMKFEDSGKYLGTFTGTLTGVVAKSQYELDKEKGFPLRDYIRQIVREEIAAHEERLNGIQKTVNISVGESGKKPFPI